MYSYVIYNADSKSDLGLHGKVLVSKILLFLRIKMTKTIEKPSKTPQKPLKPSSTHNSQKHQKKFWPRCTWPRRPSRPHAYSRRWFAISRISPKLELYRANQDRIRNQRPLLGRNTLFLGRKAVFFCKVVPEFQPQCHINIFLKYQILSEMRKHLNVRNNT